MFSSTVVLTCSSSALACTVVVITTGARKRPTHSIASTAMMLLDYGSDCEPKVYAQLGQHPPRRTTVLALGDSLLFENLAA